MEANSQRHILSVLRPEESSAPTHLIGDSLQPYSRKNLFVSV
jgi:hypothetical protein